MSRTHFALHVFVDEELRRANARERSLERIRRHFLRTEVAVAEREPDETDRCRLLFWKARSEQNGIGLFGQKRRIRERARSHNA